jgi:signal transduction histidine kinase
MRQSTLYSALFAAAAFFCAGCVQDNGPVLMTGQWTYTIGFDSSVVSGTRNVSWQPIVIPGSFPKNDSGLIRAKAITLRHKISPAFSGDPANCPALALLTGRASDTARFFLNGAPICYSGTDRPFIAGIDRESIVPVQQSLVPKVPSCYLYIVYTYEPLTRFHGVRVAPMLGEAGAIFKNYSREMLLTIFILGLFFSVGLYYIVLGLLRPKDLHNLYFGLLTLSFVLFMSANTIVKDTIYLLHSPLEEEVDLCAGIATIAFLVLFITRVITRRLGKIPVVSVALLVALFIIGLLSHGSAMSFVRYCWYAISLALVPYFLWYVFVHALKGSRDARILMAGIIVFMVSGIHDLLAFEGYVPFLFSMPYAFMFFLAAMTLLLSQKFVSVHNSMELLNETLEQRVRERTEELEDLNRQKDKMIGVIAHDLNNPITAISITASLVEISLKNGETKSVGEQLALIKQACSQAGATVRDVLAHARRRETGADVAKERIDLSGALVPVCGLCRVRAKEKGVEFQCNVPCPPVFVFVNKDAVTRVVDNLLSNAVKFTPRHGRVSLALESGEGSARIIVADTGIGIPPELKGSIFERFTTAGRSGTDHEASTGLGLSIARDIVQKNGGTIRVESDVGRGSTFIVVLPLSG